MNTFTLLIFLFPLFFVIVIIKKILFWLYLWQLKEYHPGRLLNHFSTAKGRELLLNKVNLLKIFFLFIIIYSYLLPDDPPADSWLGSFILSLLSLFFIYTAEGLKALKDFFQKTLKKPIFTKKIILLFSIIVIAAAIFFYSALQRLDLLSILIFDLLIPLIVSAVILLFQPLAVLARNQIIGKAKRKREKFRDLLVIGITGSYGKTSTKEFLATILSEKYNVLKTKEHQNSEVGISQCIINDLKPEHQIFVCEMGAYNRGGIKLLCDIVKPKIGILTGINEQHMATYGSLENIIRTKFELIKALPEDGLAILNDSDPKIKNEKLKIKNYNLKLKNIKFYSVDDKKDVWAEDINIEKEFISFKAVAKDGDYADFKVNLLGKQNILNILGVAAVAKELGMNLKEISAACEKIEPEQSGFQLKKGIGGLNVIDATYSANPDGVISHLEYLKTFPGKKVIVMPCLIELGKASKEIHKRIGRKIGEVCDLTIITTKDRFQEIVEGARFRQCFGGREIKILFLENPKEIFEKIKNFTKEGDVVLLESRVPELLIKQLLNETI